MTDFPMNRERASGSGDSGPHTQNAASAPGDRRWRLMGDVAIFQGKLLLDGLRDVVLSPVSLAAALIGIATSRDNPGRHFYRLMEWGRWSDRAIDLFHARGGKPEEDNRAKTEGGDVDRLAAELERVLIERYSRSTLAKTAKQSIDQGLDRMNATPAIDPESLREAARHIARGLERAGLKRRRRPPIAQGLSGGTRPPSPRDRD